MFLVIKPDGFASPYGFLLGNVLYEHLSLLSMKDANFFK